MINVFAAGSLLSRFSELNMPRPEQIIGSQTTLRPSTELRAGLLPDCYKIKITTPQFRLIYHVNDAKRLLTILSVATRDDVYAELRMRLGA